MERRYKNKREIYAKFLRIVFSLAFASFAYVIIYMRNRESRIVSIPLHVVESPIVVNESNIPPSVEIEILGDAGLIYNIDPDSVSATLDCSCLSEAGIYDVPVSVDYTFGLVNKFSVEIVNRKPKVRISFKDRQ